MRESSKTPRHEAKQECALSRRLSRNWYVCSDRLGIDDHSAIQSVASAKKQNAWSCMNRKSGGKKRRN